MKVSGIEIEDNILEDGDGKRSLGKAKKRSFKSFVLDMLLLIIACSAGCFATVAVMIPNGLTSGGLTGIARLLQDFLPVSFALLYYLLVLAILLLVLVFLGIREVRKSILLTVMYPTILIILENTEVRFLESKDILLAAVFCGVFSGICSGIALDRGYVFGGTDAVAKIIHVKLMPQVSRSRIAIVMDALIIVISAFVFGRNIALYALITQAVVAKTVDVVVFGLQGRLVQIDIITRDKAEPIIEYILKEMERGVSSEKVIGEYTKERLTKLTLLCSPRESVIFKKALPLLDPKAFVTLRQVDKVWGAGKGFKDIDDEF